MASLVIGRSASYVGSALVGGRFDVVRQSIINGIDSAQSEGTGWDAVVKAGLATTSVVRTSDTVVTVTLSAFGSYNITAQETITVTVPAGALVGAAQIVASPTFTIDTVAAVAPLPMATIKRQAVKRAAYF